MICEYRFLSEKISKLIFLSFSVIDNNILKNKFLDKKVKKYKNKKIMRHLH